MKKILLITMITIVTFTSVGCGCDKKEETIKKEEQVSEIKKTEEKSVVNYENDVVKDQQVEMFKMTNTSLTFENGISKLRTEVTNTSTEIQNLKTFDIIVKDKYGREIKTMLGYIGTQVLPGETKILTTNTDLDLSNAASIEYKINR